MRNVLVTCLVLGAASVTLVPTARAADPYWRQHKEVDWQSRTEFKAPEQQRPDWLREHCVRDWDGHELCRR
jgi:hypothetical protein